MKIDLKKEKLPILIMITTIALAIYFYTIFPDRVATHWNFAGKPDDFSGKAFGAFFVPVLMLFIFIILRILPYFDPKRQNYILFEKTYRLLINSFLIFFLGIFIVVSLANLNFNIPVNTLIPALVGGLFILFGSQMKNIKQNWFMGFRLPWTLSSESVWNKTHHFGGWAMIFCGGILFITPLLPEPVAIILFIFAIFGMILSTTVYSYLIYRKENKTQG